MAYWLLLLLSSTVLASPCPPPDCGDCYTWDPNIEECVWDCVDCQVCEDCNCVKDPNVECDHDTDCGDPNCWDCLSCECECDITVNSVSSNKDVTCVDCNVTFTANVSGSCSCVDWSGGGDPCTASDTCTFTTHWDSPGTKTVTATPDCGSSKQKQVTIAEPNNFHQIDYWVEDDNVLCFSYGWDSSTGDLNDLSDCRLGEKVDYPGGNPYCWPSPWSNCETNPYITEGVPTTGYGEDRHDPGEFVKPYEAAAFTASQIFRYRGCAADSYTTLMGPLSIDRGVFWSILLECWFYSCTKSGAFVLWSLPP